MKKMLIIYRYVTQLCTKAYVWFKAFVSAGKRKAKMEGKLLKGGSEIDGRFDQFLSNTKVEITPKLWEKIKEVHLT